MSILNIDLHSSHAPYHSALEAVVPPRSLKPGLLQAVAHIESPTTITTSQYETIYECVRRVDSRELEAVLLEALATPLTEPEKRALIELDWEHPIFTSEKLQHYALLLFVSGQIDRNVFSEILIMDQCRREGGTSFPLLDADGSSNWKAEFLMCDMISQDCISPRDLAKFMKKIPKNPRVKRFQVHLFAYPNSAQNVAMRIHELHPGLFSRRAEDRIEFMLLSPNLAQALFDEEFTQRNELKDRLLQLNPVLGDSVAAANFQHDKRRDVRLPCSLFTQRIAADGYPASPAAFYFHDTWFHGHLDAAIHDRAAWIAFSHILDPKRGPLADKVNPLLLDRLFKSAVDREFSQYQKEYRDTFSLKSKEIFWVTLFGLSWLTEKIKSNKDQYKAIYKELFRQVQAAPVTWQKLGIDTDFPAVIQEVQRKIQNEENGFHYLIKPLPLFLALDALRELGLCS